MAVFVSILVSRQAGRASTRGFGIGQAAELLSDPLLAIGLRSGCTANLTSPSPPFPKFGLPEYLPTQRKWTCSGTQQSLKSVLVDIANLTLRLSLTYARGVFLQTATTRTPVYGDSLYSVLVEIKYLPKFIYQLRDLRRHLRDFTMKCYLRLLRIIKKFLH